MMINIYHWPHIVVGAENTVVKKEKRDDVSALREIQF